MLRRNRAQCRQSVYIYTQSGHTLPSNSELSNIMHSSLAQVVIKFSAFYEEPECPLSYSPNTVTERYHELDETSLPLQTLFHRDPSLYYPPISNLQT
jgi:hypothetical protein